MTRCTVVLGLKRKLKRPPSLSSDVSAPRLFDVVANGRGTFNRTLTTGRNALQATKDHIGRTQKGAVKDVPCLSFVFCFDSGLATSHDCAI